MFGTFISDFVITLPNRGSSKTSAVVFFKIIIITGFFHQTGFVEGEAAGFASCAASGFGCRIAVNITRTGAVAVHRVAVRHAGRAGDFIALVTRPTGVVSSRTIRTGVIMTVGGFGTNFVAAGAVAGFTALAL